MEQDYDRIFYDYVTKAEYMDPLKAMILLTKACMDYQGISKGFSTMAYYAGWWWLENFNKTDHPMVKQTSNLTFAEVMPMICPEYSQEEYDKFDVIHIDSEYEEQVLYEMMEELDDETVCALCRGYWLGNL